MKVAVKHTNTFVEVAHYRAVNKGCLTGFFTLVEYNDDCPNGRRTSSCKIFTKDNRQWIGFPDQEVKAQAPGEKSTFFPYVSFADKEFQKNLSEAALECIKEAQKAAVPAPAPVQPPIDW